MGFLMGLKGGYTKYPGYLCLWDSRANAQHYVRWSWPIRTEFCVGKQNVKFESIVGAEKVLMPPLHIKLGLMKQFVKKLDDKIRSFWIFKKNFPKLSEPKVKAGVFDGPQIRQIFVDEKFPNLLNRAQKASWDSFKAVVSGFLGNNKAENNQKLVENMLKNFKTMGYRM